MRCRDTEGGSQWRKSDGKYTNTTENSYTQTQSTAVIIKLENKNTFCKTMLLPPCDNDSVHVHSQTVAETAGNVAATPVQGIAGSLDDVCTVCAYTHEDAYM